MGLIADAKASVDRLLHSRDDRWCPRCGSILTTTDGRRLRSPRDLDAIRSVRIQRQRWFSCRLRHTEELAAIAPYPSHTLPVQRKVVDIRTTMRVALGVALPRCADWITA